MLTQLPRMIQLPRVMTVLTMTACFAATLPVTAQETDFDGYLARLQTVGGAEVSLTPPAAGELDGYSQRLQDAIVLNRTLGSQGVDGAEVNQEEARVLQLLEEARSYSEAKLLARIVFGDSSPAPQVPAEISDDPWDPDWEFEDFAVSLPERTVEALQARRSGRDAVLDALTDAEFDAYARGEELIYRAQREEAATARGRRFDDRDDLYVAVLNNGQAWRRKVPRGYVEPPGTGGEPGGSQGDDGGLPELDDVSAALDKVILGTDTRKLRSVFSGHSMQGAVWQPKGAILDASDSANANPIVVDCTGVKISGRLVATAGHCLFKDGSWNNNRKWVPGADGVATIMGLTSDPSPNGNKSSWTRSARGAWIDHEWVNYDFGLFVLYDNQNSCNMPWHGWQNTSLLNKTVFLYGYPGSTGFCSASPLGSSLCFGSIYGDSGKITYAGSYQVRYAIDTQGGQSGTGFYRIVDGERLVVGVHHGGYSSSRNRGVRINNGNAKMIKDVKADNPSSFCS